MLSEAKYLVGEDITSLSLRGAAGDVGVSRSEMYMPAKTEILASRLMAAPQNDRVGLSTVHIVPNRILTSCVPHFPE